MRRRRCQCQSCCGTTSYRTSGSVTAVRAAAYGVSASQTMLEILTQLIESLGYNEAAEAGGSDLIPALA